MRGEASRCRDELVPGETLYRSLEHLLQVTCSDSGYNHVTPLGAERAKPLGSNIQNDIDQRLGRFASRSKPQQMSTMRTRGIERRLRGVDLQVVAAHGTAIG